MKKRKMKHLKYFLQGFFVLLVIVLGLWFVMAVSTPANLIFNGNTTSNYDNDGEFTLNWSTSGDAAVNFSIYIKADGILFAKVGNDSTLGYSFSNTTNTNYSFTVEAENATGTFTNSSVDAVWIVVDTINPSVSYITGTSENNTGANRDWIFVNVTASDSNNDSLIYSLYNETDLVNKTIFTDSYGTLSINWTGLPEAKYTFNVTANDSATNENSTSSRIFYLDTTNPGASLSKTSSTTSSIVVSASCSDATSGIASCVVSSSAGSVSGSTISGLSCGNPYTITLTATDNAGNTVSTSTSMSTEPCGGGSAATPSEWVSQRSHSWARIRVGETATMESFDLDTGVNRIQIQVRNEVQNVKIEVKKYDNKPAEVSVEKSGKVHKYLQIETENLANNLERATVRIQVQKSWMESNNLQIENVAMFRFNENNQWVELETDYVESDNDYYYYDVELDSFSYFAIGESLIAETEDEIKTPILDTEGKNLTWLWVLIVVVVLGVLWFAFEKKGKKRKN